MFVLEVCNLTNNESPANNATNDEIDPSREYKLQLFIIPWAVIKRCYFIDDAEKSISYYQEQFVSSSDAAKLFSPISVNMQSKFIVTQNIGVRIAMLRWMLSKNQNKKTKTKTKINYHWFWNKPQLIIL